MSRAWNARALLLETQLTSAYLVFRQVPKLQLMANKLVRVCYVLLVCLATFCLFGAYAARGTHAFCACQVSFVAVVVVVVVFRCCVSDCSCEFVLGGCC